MDDLTTDEDIRAKQRFILRADICEFADKLQAEGFERIDITTEMLVVGVSGLVASLGSENASAILEDLVQSASVQHQKVMPQQQRPN